MAQREPSPDRDTGDGVSLGEDTEELAREFLQHRPRLLGVAYRLLGTSGTPRTSSPTPWCVG